NPSSFTFSYTVEAGGFQDSADVTLSFVAGANPIANPDGCPQTGYLCTPVSEGTALRIPYAVLTANDAVEGGGPTTGLDIRRGSFSKPENGRIDLCCDPDAFWYVPDEDFVGDDVFTYQLSNDGNPAIATAEVVVQVAGNGPATDPTQAAYDWIRLDLPASGSVSVPITFSELLQNDSGDDLELIQPCAHQPNIGTLNCPNTDPVHGYMVYETSGFLTTSFVYFRYDIQGADGQTSSSTNSQIFRTRPSDPRLIVGTSDLMQVPEGENLVVGWADLLDNDRIPYSGGSTNPLDFVDYFGAGRPLHGSARHVGTAWGGFTYQAPTNFLGADRMAYTVLDPVSGERGVAQLVVEVTPGAPIAQDDRLYTYPDLPRQLGVLVNDLDPQGQSQTDSLEVVAVGELLSGEGSATLGAGGEVWYTPGGYLHDPATFTYTVEDIWGNQATALVAVILTQPPEPQAAVLCEALHCLFTDHSTGAELQLRWTFPGGIEANVAAVEMDFSQPGTYPVTLEVTDALGTVDSVSLDAEVTGQEVHDPPVALLEVRHLAGTNYELDWGGSSDDVGFASVSLDVDGTVLAPESTVVPWTFPSIATTRPVTLTVTDYAGQTDQVTVLVVVDPGPPSEEI
ncbi:MAG: PKD domain-containing protein, partial [Acidobacteria bacterium]|nr:PKD domain-containing protein [Acidobacteriota bacterium]